MKSSKTMGILAMACLLLILPLLAACGGDDNETARPTTSPTPTTSPEPAPTRQNVTITVGLLGDLSGPAASAVKKVKDGLSDYLRMIEEQRPIEGIDIEFIYYDTKLTEERFLTGYQELRNQGVDVIFTPDGPEVHELIIEDMERDQIPVIGSSATLTLLQDEWSFCQWAAHTWEMEGVLEYIVNIWDYSAMGRSPRVGCIGLTDNRTMLAMADKLEEIRLVDPDKFELKTEFVGMNDQDLSDQVESLMASDFIILNLYAMPMGNFIKQALEGGFEGKFTGKATWIQAFWPLVQMLRVSPESLDRSTVVLSQTPTWTDRESVPIFNDIERLLETYRSDVLEEYKTKPGYEGGVYPAMILEDAIRRAADEIVSKPEMTGVILRDSLAAMSIELQGWGNVWNYPEGFKANLRSWKMYEWRDAEAGWFAITDWFRPASVPE